MADRETGRRVLTPVLGNVSRVFCFCAVLTAAVYLFLASQVSVWRHSGAAYCMLDCMHALEAPERFGLLYMSLTLWIAAGYKKIYTQPGFVVQYGSLDRLWKGLYTDQIILSVLAGSFYSGIACFFSGMASACVNNWNSTQSMFYQKTEMTYEGSVLLVMVMFFLMNILKTALLVLGIDLLEEWLGSFLYGYMALGFLIVVEWIPPQPELFFNRFSVSQKNFASSGSVLLLPAVGIAGLLCMFYVGRKIWRKKEFYGA